MGYQSAETCEKCTTELVTIAIRVDGNDLEMHSCTTCDVRTWSHAGEPVDLAFALSEVGQHAGRQR